MAAYLPGRVITTTALLLLLIVSNVAPGQSIAIGETICAEGFVMDNECLFLNVDSQGQGRLLDTGEVTLAAPGSHTLHCLVDLTVCNIGPWFILQDPTATSGGLHTVQYQLNDHTGMLTLARQAGRSGGGCGTCQGGANGLVVGLRVEVQGVVTALGDGSNNNPPRIDVTSMRVSNGLPVTSLCANVPPAGNGLFRFIELILRLIVRIFLGGGGGGRR